MQSDLFGNVVYLPPIQIGKAFYRSEEWQRLRYSALLESAGRCECCGIRPDKDNPLHVDHIKPRSKYPWLSLDPRNLQVLCSDAISAKAMSIARIGVTMPSARGPPWGQISRSQGNQS
jgi:5-methylcytosine-specific restriction endonuclease McrA